MPFPFVPGLGVYSQSYTFRDAKGNTSAFRVFIDEGAAGDADAVQAFAVSLRDALIALTNAAFQGARGTLTEYGVAQYGAHAVGGAYESIVEKAVLVFQDLAGQLHRYEIPAPKIALFKADKVTVDPTNGSVVTFVGLMTQAAPGVHVVSRQDIGLANYMGGVFKARKIRRRLNILVLEPDLTGSLPAE